MEAPLLAALDAARALGDLLIARSSSSLDGDGAWSGAFASIGDLGPADLASAVRGCWSSVFRPDALGRFRATGIDPGAVGLAVLIQRQVAPRCGGLAEASPDGRVRLWAAAGPPAPLLSGLVSGVRGTIGTDGGIDGSLADLPVTPGALRALADAVRAARQVPGAGRVEWAVEGDQPWILQLDPIDQHPEPASEDARALPVGRAWRGAPASPGVASGRVARCAAAEADASPSVAGRVLVVDHPLPRFAPLLWEVTALVALYGDPAAHLCEVARSLHVPAVVGLASGIAAPPDLDWADQELVLTVDGTLGGVSCVERGVSVGADHALG